MTAAIPTLPPEVLDQLAPVIDLIAAEARANVLQVERARIKRAGDVAVRANGGRGSGHDDGFKAIMRDVFPDAPKETEAQREQARQEAMEERGCQCGDCDDLECEGDCESCNNYSCTQCHNTSECCGICESCDTCHEDGNHNREAYSSDSSDARFCVSCRHFCSDYD
jgi:hypothetical protein